MGIFSTVVVTIAGYALSTWLFVCFAGLMIDYLFPIWEFNFAVGLMILMLLIITLLYLVGMVVLTRWLIKRINLVQVTEEDVIAIVTNKRIEHHTYTTMAGKVPIMHQTTNYDIMIVHGEYKGTVDDYSMYQR